MSSDWAKFGVGKLLTSPDTMVVLVLCKIDVSDLWAWFYDTPKNDAKSDT